MQLTPEVTEVKSIRVCRETQRQRWVQVEDVGDIVYRADGDEAGCGGKKDRLRWRWWEERSFGGETLHAYDCKHYDTRPSCSSCNLRCFYSSPILRRRYASPESISTEFSASLPEFVWFNNSIYLWVSSVVYITAGYKHDIKSNQLEYRSIARTLFNREALALLNPTSDWLI